MAASEGLQFEVLVSQGLTVLKNTDLLITQDTKLCCWKFFSLYERLRCSWVEKISELSRFFSLLQSIVINVFKANECVRQRQRLLSYFLRFIKVWTLYQNPRGLGRSLVSCGWRWDVQWQRGPMPSQLYQDQWPVTHWPLLNWRGGPFICTGDVEEASAGNGRAQSQGVFLVLWNGVSIKEAKRRSDVFSSEEKNQLFRFFQQHNSLSSLSQRHTTLWQSIQQPCGLESILFFGYCSPGVPFSAKGPGGTLTSDGETQCNYLKDRVTFQGYQNDSHSAASLSFLRHKESGARAVFCAEVDWKWGAEWVLSGHFKKSLCHPEFESILWNS